MSKRETRELLSDIREAIRRIELYTKGTDYQEFLKDIKVQDAVMRNLEIIGEAVKNIASDFKVRHKDIEWKNIAGMRDKIIHHYFGVNWDIVWDEIEEKLPRLKSRIESLLQEEE
jgi:uncharacterized protein with HEPN domain